MPSLTRSLSVNKRKNEKEERAAPEAFGQLSASRGWCRAQLSAARLGLALRRLSPPPRHRVCRDTHRVPLAPHPPAGPEWEAGTAPVQRNSFDILESGKVFWLPTARAGAWARPSSPRPSQECKYFIFLLKPPRSNPRNNPGRGKSPRRSLLTPSPHSGISVSSDDKMTSLPKVIYTVAKCCKYFHYTKKPPLD